MKEEKNFVSWSDSQFTVRQMLIVLIVWLALIGTGAAALRLLNTMRSRGDWHTACRA